MVRRWSHINQLKSLPSLADKKIRIGSSDSIINSLMYLRKDFAAVTTARRKGWARRVHINDLLSTSNVLIVWAREYRFYRNYNRSIFYQFFSKYTYLSFNLMFSKSLTSRYSRANVGSLGSGVSKRLVNYFSRSFVYSRLGFLSDYRSSSWSVASFGDRMTGAKDTNLGLHYPVSVISPNSLSPLGAQTGAVRVLQLLSSLPLDLLRRWSTDLYASLVKLFYLKVILNHVFCSYKSWKLPQMRPVTSLN